MAAVNTTNGTYLASLFNPQVIGDMIEEKLVKNMVFAPLARIDTTLEGRPGNTITLPYFSYIGDASVVAEGTDITIKKLTASTKEVTIQKIGNGVQITDEAVLSGYGEPIGEATSQLALSIASTVDNQLLAALDGNTKNVYAMTADFTPDDLRKALVKFGEDNAGPKAIVVDPDGYTALLNVNSYVPASEIAANLLIQGSVGMVYGTNIIVSERITDTYHIVKPGALALYMKRDTMVETDRDIVNKSTVITADKHFATYLYKPGDAIKMTKAGG